MGCLKFSTEFLLPTTVCSILASSGCVFNVDHFKVKQDTGIERYSWWPPGSPMDALDTSQCLYG